MLDMTAPVSNAAPPPVQVQPAAAPQASVSAQPQPPPQRIPSRLSNVAKAALQEALETTVQTKKKPLVATFRPSICSRERPQRKRSGLRRPKES